MRVLFRYVGLAPLPELLMLYYKAQGAQVRTVSIYSYFLVIWLRTLHESRISMPRRLRVETRI